MMEETFVSTVAFKSNLQIISAKSIREDKKFLASVRDPFGLEFMRKRNLPMTPIQLVEFNKASMHCVYAFEGDYPFGTVIDKNGTEKVVCKCININCGNFAQCRPDFKPEEMRSSDENSALKDAVQRALSIFSAESEPDDDQDGDISAASLIFDSTETDAPDSTISSETPVQLSTEDEIAVDEQENEQQKSEEAPETIEDATFASFTVVEQGVIIRSAPEKRSVVNSGPGTGKTWTLIEKVKYMLNDDNVDPENILILCFSRAAVDVIRSRLKKSADKGELPLTWHMVDVRTFDSFSTYMLAWLSENIPELLPEGFSLEALDYDSRIAIAASVFKKDKNMLAEYEHIIVDEVQDLVGVRAELVLSILESLPFRCGFTLLGDSCQALYDYLAEDNADVLSSADFYKRLFHEFNYSDYYTLDKNYRQGDEFGSSTVPYRETILAGKPEDRIREATALSERINTADINLKHFSVEKANEYVKKGTLGILTRTNGQALQISAWLRNEGVDHQLQKQSGARDFAGWISKVAFNSETDVLGKEEFISIFEGIYHTDTSVSEQYWKALISTQRSTESNYFEIEDLLRGLLENARDSLLFQDPEWRTSAITVSNIHRAKGREFDTVLVIEDVISQMTQLENDDELEHKVCYVALTRPKKRIEKVMLSPQYIYIMKDETRRCFRGGGFAGRKYLSHFEVGESGDLDERSFAIDCETQDRIREIIGYGTRLKLLKCPEGTKSYVVYKIVAEDCEKEILGYTSRKFADCMRKAIQRVYSNYGTIAYKYFPRILGDVYADGLTTCVSTIDGGIDGAKRFGDMFVWNGISLNGFAQLEKDSY
ncbi:MAG: AAA family ATPase [Bacteroides thetaiotaomicron]|nr:AAA family ATPase [Bacteroides thetaiotaomicron]